MILAADGVPWYTSGTVWSIAAVAVAVIAVPIGAWVAFRSNNPKRRLYTWLSDVTPLLNQRAKELEVRHQGQTLAEPHLVTVRLTVRSRRDIAPDSFAGPIVLDLGTPVLTKFSQKAATKRAGIPDPEITVAGHTLEIQPCLLARDHDVAISILLDSRPQFRALRVALTDVETLTASPSITTSPRTSMLMTGGALAVSTGLVGYIFYNAAHQFIPRGIVGPDRVYENEGWRLLFMSGAFSAISFSIIATGLVTLGHWARRRRIR